MPEDTRSVILKATRALIDEKGLEAVTLRAVGAGAGLSRGAAYRHFANKDDLLAAITLEDFELLMKNLAALDTRRLRPEELLLEVLLKYYSFGVSNKVHYQLMFTMPWPEEKFPLLREKGKAAFHMLDALVGNVFGAGTRSGNRSGESAASRTAIVFAFIHGLVELHLSGHTEEVKGLNDAKELIGVFIRQMAG